MMCETKLVLLGTGTPNAEPFASGPSSAVVVDGHAYLVDFGPGVVRQCARAYENGISALHPKISRSPSAPTCTPTTPPGTPTCCLPHGCWSGRPP